MPSEHDPGYLETCDLCHDQFPLPLIIFTGKQFLCFKCHGNEETVVILNNNNQPINNHGNTTNSEIGQN